MGKVGALAIKQQNTILLMSLLSTQVRTNLANGVDYIHNENKFTRDHFANSSHKNLIFICEC